MPQYKCKKCGNIMEVADDVKIAVCDKCFEKQSLSVSDASNASADEPVSVNVSASPEVKPLLERVFIFLEDGEWQRANEYCEKVLDIEPKNALAYLGKLMVNLGVRKHEDLKNYPNHFVSNNNYQKIMRFGDDVIINEMKEAVDAIESRLENQRQTAEEMRAAQENERKERIYQAIISQNPENPNTNSNVSLMTRLINDLLSLGNFKDSEQLVEKYRQIIYDKASGMIENESEADREYARQVFEYLIDYKDSKQLLENYYERKNKEKEERVLAFKAKIKKTLKIVIPVSIVIVLAVVFFVFILPEIKYNKGVKFLESGNYDAAIAQFEDIVEYKDSEYLKSISEKEKELATNYSKALEELNKGNRNNAMMLFAKAKGYKDAKAQKVSLIKELSKSSVSIGSEHVVAIKTDGTVIATEYYDSPSSSYDDYNGQCDVDDWTDIVAVSAGGRYTVGLKKDGTVVATEYIYDPHYDYYGQCDVEGWTDIVAISAGGSHTVGLKSDGTVVAVGNNNYGQCDVYNWTGIIAISAGSRHTVGLTKDGKVVSAGSNENGQSKVDRWKGIVAVSAGDYHTVGLKSDGTVVSTEFIESYDFDEYYDKGQCEVDDWTDIIAVTAGESNTVGIKADGTVVSTTYVGDEFYNYGQCNVEDWKDIVAVDAEHLCTIGLKSDGTVIRAGDFELGGCKVDDWSGIKTP